jgi:serine/threonine-protein kinase
VEEEQTGSPRPEIPGFHLLRLIGSGGMGSVYAAENLTTHETFAVKVMHKHLASDRAHAARFEREVRVLRGIRHPNVVEVYESGQPSADGSTPAFVVMELLEGETLQDLLRRTPILPPALAVSLMLQILDGLAAAHHAGVLHRDMGPSNVFLIPKAGGRYRVKLLDFGLARPVLAEDASGAVTQPGTLMGKPAYAAPEMFAERPLCEAGDVFACGIMLFKMLTGRLPYKANTAQMLWVERFAERDSTQPYPSVLEHQPTVPVELAQVVADATRRQLAQRLPTAREFQKRLLALEGLFSSETNTSTTQRLMALKAEPRPPARQASSTVGATTASLRATLNGMNRRRWLVAGAAALGLVGLTLLVVRLAGGFGGSAPDRTEPSSPVLAAAPPTATTTAPDAGTTAPPTSDAGAPGPETGAAATAAVATPDGADSAASATTADVPGPADTALAAGDAPVDRAAAPPPATVRFTFVELPPRAVAWAGGVRVAENGVIDLPRSARPVELRVEVPGGRLQPWSERLVPDRDRTIRPTLRRVATATTPRDGGSATRDAGVARLDGGVFATHYP